MIKIIPEAKYSTDKTEQWFIDQLKKGKNIDDWVLLPNLILRSLDEKKDNKTYDSEKDSGGEIDSVILIPGRGIVLIETKSHKDISIGGDGTWYEYTNKTFESNRKRDPINQSIRNRELLLNRIPPYLGIKFNQIYSFICIPNQVLLINQNAEFSQNRIIDKSAIINNEISELISREIPKSDPLFGKIDIQTIIESLKPLNSNKNANYYEYIEKTMSDLDQEQKNFLEPIEERKQIYFEGLAGTGKTMILEYSSLRSAKKNPDNKILFLTYNKLISAKIRSSIEQKNSDSNIKVIAIYELMKEIIIYKERGLDDEEKNAEKEGSENNFWESLPSRSINLLNEHADLANKYLFDEIYIDEGQDIISENNDIVLDFINQILKGGLKNGLWMIAADFNQNIYSKDSKLPPDLILGDRIGRDLDNEKFTLKVNYRNHQKLGNDVHDFISKKDEYTRYHHKDRNKPMFYDCNDINEEIDALDKILEDLIDKKDIPKQEITVLSIFTNQKRKNPLYHGKYKNDFIELSPEYFSEPKPNKIIFSTVHSYKGLEDKIIILTSVDIENKINNKYDTNSIKGGVSLLSTGAFRCISDLYVIVRNI